MQRNAELVGLGTHPSWPMLQEEVAVRRAQIESQILTWAISPAGVDQRKIDYLRGVLMGMVWLAEKPANAERSLEKALAEQGVQIDEEAAA
jgi:hypothetical protein